MFVYWNSKQTIKKCNFEYELQATTRWHSIIWETFARSSVETWYMQGKTWYGSYEGNFNINLLDFENNKKNQSFVNLTFRCGMVPVINKPARVMRYTATGIDHMFTNSIIKTEIKSVINLQWTFSQDKNQIKTSRSQPATLLIKRLWYRYFPVNFAKFLRTPFLTEHLRWLLLKKTKTMKKTT